MTPLWLVVCLTLALSTDRILAGYRSYLRNLGPMGPMGNQRMPYLSATGPTGNEPPPILSNPDDPSVAENNPAEVPTYMLGNSQGQPKISANPDFQPIMPVAVNPQPQLAGAAFSINPSRIPQDVKQFAFKTIESKSNSNFARRIVDIKDATQQIVAGSVFTFTLVLADTNCRKTDQDLDNLNQQCDVRRGSVQTSCNVRVYAGIQEMQANGQCQSFSPDMSSGGGSGLSFVPGYGLGYGHGPVVPPSLPDGATPINPYVSSGSGFVPDSGSMSGGFVPDSGSMSGGFVPGSGSMSGGFVPGSGSMSGPPYGTGPVLGSDIGGASLPGGATPINPTAIPLKAREYAFSTMESESNSTWARKVLEIRDASKQIVAGTIYRFTMVLVKTSCQKDGSDQEHFNDNCAIRRGAPKEICRVKVFLGVRQTNVQAECQMQMRSRGDRALIQSNDCPFHYNRAMPYSKDVDNNPDEDNPLITSTAKICQRLCQQSRSCDRWSWVEMGIKHGREAVYYDGRTRHECLQWTGDLIEDRLVQAFGIISGAKDC